MIITPFNKGARCHNPFVSTLTFLTISCFIQISQSGEKCKEKERFGRKCLHRELRYQSDLIVLGENRVTTTGKVCKDVMDRERVSIRVDKFLVYWIRVYLKKSSSAWDLEISMRLPNNEVRSCLNDRRYTFHGIVDVECETEKGVAFVDIAGDIKTTCDIYISGGQNLGSTGKPRMTRSTELPGYCVDLDLLTKCSSLVKPNASWWLTMNNIAHIISYEITNNNLRMDAFRQHRIAILDDTGDNIWSFTDDSKVGKPTYRKDIEVLLPTRTFMISARRDQPLVLKEVKLYGETVCTHTKTPSYGIHCDQPCNCADKSERCFPATGGCPKGCKPGFSGVDCKEPCKNSSWGINCAFTCSEGCGGACDSVNGLCPECLPGFNGSKCEQPCETGRYGVDCVDTCLNCLDDNCQKNGTCVFSQCKAGWLGEKCDQKCEEGTWGLNCDTECSENCGGDGQCHHTDGACLDGCKDGFKPPDCLQDIALSHLRLVAVLCVCLPIPVMSPLIYFLWDIENRLKNEFTGKDITFTFK